MNINASNPSLINILLQQATKAQEKTAKRPTFEQVFAKLNARNARMDSNKKPMNSLLTNEQLFRYYIKDTDPKLRISDDSFNIEDTLNPMKESDPNKIYGSGATQSTDTIPSRNPYNNGFNVGFQDPLQAQAQARAGAAAAAGRPISRKLSTLAQQYAGTAQPASAAAAAAAVADESGQVPTVFAPMPEVLGDAAAIQQADNIYKEAIAVNNRLESVDYSSVSEEAQLLLKLFFNDNYQDTSAYFLRVLADSRSGGIESAVSGLFNLFYQTRLNKPTNEFLNNRIAEMVGADFTAGPAVREDFDKLFNLNNVSVQEFLTNIKPKLANAYFTDREKARMDRELTFIDGYSLANTVGGYLTTKEQDYYRVYGNTIVYNALSTDPIDPFEIFNKNAADERNAEAIFEGLMDELFIDTATEMITNTDINSIVLDPELVKKLAERARAKASAASTAPSAPTAPAININAPAAPAEAGMGEVNIDNVITKRGRGVQAGDIRGPYNKPKKMAQDILGDIIGEAVSQGESRKK
jgi:hypothetical protein